MPNESRGRISYKNQEILVIVNPKNKGANAIRLASKWGLGKNTWIVRKIDTKNNVK